jgi:hypothetical protein
MTVKEALEKLDKKDLLKKLVSTGKWKRGAIDTAFSRGTISKKLAPDMELFTSISAKFWIMPESYKMDGSRK